MRITLLLCLLLSSSVMAQRTIDQKIDIKGAKEIQLNFTYSDIELIEGEGKDIHITGVVSINLNLDNEAFQITTEQPNSDLLIVHSNVNTKDIPKRVIVNTPDGNRRIISSEELDKGKIYNDVSWGTDVNAKLKVSIPKGVKVISNTTYGNILVNPIYELEMVSATYGSITAFLGDRAIPHDLLLVSTYGFVDVSIPKNFAAQVEADVTYGEMFTDLDFNGQQKSVQNNQCRSNSSFKENLNNGSNRLNVESSYGNLFLRKDTGTRNTGRIKKLINRF